MKTLVISGISRGIGRATAERFLAEGWRVIGTTTRGLPYTHTNLIAVTLDVTDEQSRSAGIETIRAHVETIDVLINNAGIYLDEDDKGNELRIEILQTILSVNLLGAVAFTESLLGLMNENSHIIAVSSSYGIMCSERNDQSAPAYSISKAALGMYMKVLAARLKSRAITISALDPGWVRTDMGGEEAPRDVSEPADELFRLATSPVPSGKMWHKGEKQSW